MLKILVLGGGYAGLSFIKNLDSNIAKSANITLISNTNFHYKSILLHEVVSHRDDITIPYSNILPNFINFINDEIIEIKEDIVIAKNNQYEYDILVVALGFNSDDFGIKGVKEYAYSMVNYNNCLVLNDMIEKQTNGDIVVCGAGFSGIELIGNLAYKFKNSNNIKLKCIEAMPMILPMFDSDNALYAKKYLEKLGVEFYLEHKILEIKQDSIIVENNGKQGEIKSNLTLWTAGVKGNAIIESSKIFDSKRSKVEVNGYLNPINCNNNNIFIIGDCALVKDNKNGRYHAPTAQIALKEGEYLARIINAKIKNQPLNKQFVYSNQGTICSLGKDCAIGVVGNKVVKGKLASILKKLIELKWDFKLKGLKALL